MLTPDSDRPGFERGLGQNRMAAQPGPQCGALCGCALSVPETITIGPMSSVPTSSVPAPTDSGRDEEADLWSAHVQTVWDAIMAGNQAMLDCLQREAAYSRAAYHGKGSGRFADAQRN